MRVTVLGCGASAGVPTITGDWGACDPSNAKNMRTRQSVVVHLNGKNLLIDAAPDLRFQMLRAKVQTIDAIFLTHAHADHCHGLDDIRDIVLKRGTGPVPLYADSQTMHEVHTKFPYLFYSKVGEPSFYPALLDDILVDTHFTCFDQVMTTFLQAHGSIYTRGLRIGDCAYSTDVVDLDEAAFAVLQGVKVWFVECLQLTPHRTHAWLDKVLLWVKRIKPAKVYLIHMDRSMDYATVSATLPENIVMCYDGMIVDI